MTEPPAEFQDYGPPTLASPVVGRPRFRVLDDVEINNRPDPLQRWIGRLQADGVALIVGQTETWKTFVTLGLELSALKGCSWLGASVLPALCSVYVAAEGASGLKSRIKAWKIVAGVPVTERLGLQIVDGSVNLFSISEVQAFIDEVIAPIAPTNVSFDTLARCCVGADENSARDMGIVIENVFRIRDAAKGPINVLHHSNANESRERGSTSMKAGADNMLMLTKTDDLVTLSSAKNKDMDAFEPLLLKLTEVPEASSCVVRLARDVAQDGLTAAQARVLTALWDTFGAEGATAVELLDGLPGMPKRTVYHARKVLIEGGYIENKGPRLYPRRRP